MIYYVDKNAKNGGDGSEAYPFRTIGAAARLARPGDEVLVYPGIYREQVNPVNAGTETQRIIYRSVKEKKAVITGAEPVKCWENQGGSVWLARIPNGLFGNFNPYQERVFGDWLIEGKDTVHRGDVFLNDHSMYEVFALSAVQNPVRSDMSWEPEFSLYTWFTEQDEKRGETLIYANFQEIDPNQENVEISVRHACFYPEKEGVGFITCSGFTICKAATQWAPPTAYQEGMVGPHWSKGWIIEDCEIYESKCSGISLGKYRQPANDNKWFFKKFKDGTQTERENICQAQLEGWNKENIGSHIVRRCDIHHCGQTGIVGHLGGVFSLIEDNHIHHINNKQNLAGAEIGGIKMHAAIDVIIRHNRIHDCTRGIWLDWQAQGTRVTRNLLYNNTLPYADRKDEKLGIAAGEDIQVEVSHGPTLIDNNILLSDYAVKIASQGVALVHNLIGGSFTSVGIGVNNGAATLPSPRYTPYHVPHETGIAGFMTILHGDCRFYNNIFVQQPKREPMLYLAEVMKDSEWMEGNLTVGTAPYEGYPSYEEYSALFEGYCGMGSPASDRYYGKLPVWAAGNAYFNDALPMSREVSDETGIRQDREHPVYLRVSEQDGHAVFETNLYDYLKKGGCGMISTKTLGMAFEPEEYYENPDGTPIVFDKDFNGAHREIYPLPGPFEKWDGKLVF